MRDNTKANIHVCAYMYVHLQNGNLIITSEMRRIVGVNLRMFYCVHEIVLG